MNPKTPTRNPHSSSRTGGGVQESEQVNAMTAKTAKTTKTELTADEKHAIRSAAAVKAAATRKAKKEALMNDTNETQPKPEAPAVVVEPVALVEAVATVGSVVKVSRKARRALAGPVAEAILAAFPAGGRIRTGETVATLTTDWKEGEGTFAEYLNELVDREMAQRQTRGEFGGDLKAVAAAERELKEKLAAVWGLRKALQLTPA
jgi:hypothetical protein